MIRTSSSYPTCAAVPDAVANQQSNLVAPKLVHNILPPPQAPIAPPPPPPANNAIKESGIISVNNDHCNVNVNSVNCGNSHQKPNLAPGWRRCSYDNEIIYISPSGDVLKNLAEIKNYLLRPGTCKCGLPCPFRPEVFFEFDPQVPNASLPINLEADLSRRFCQHQRRHLDKQELIRRGDIKNRKPSIGSEQSNATSQNQNQSQSQERIVIQTQNQNIRYNQNYSRPPPHQQLQTPVQQISVQQTTAPVGGPNYQNNNQNEVNPPARSRTPPWRKNQNKIQQNQNEQPQIVQQQNFPNERVPPLPQHQQQQQQSQQQQQQQNHWEEPQPVNHVAQKIINNKPKNNVKKRPTFKEDPTGYLNQQTAILHSSISTLHSPVGSSPSPTSSSQEKENSENEDIYSSGYETNDQVTNLPNSTTIGGQTVTHMPNGMVQVHQNCDISHLKPQQQIQFQQQLQQHNQLIRQSHELQIENETKLTPRFVPPAQESPVTSSRTPDVTSSCSTPDLKGPVQAGAITTSNRSPSLASSHPSPSESPESFVSRSSSSSFCPPKLQTVAYGQTTLKNTVTSVIAGKPMTSTTAAIRHPVEQPKLTVQNSLPVQQQQHQPQQQQQQQQQTVNFQHPNQQQIIMTSTGQIIVMPSQQNKIPIMTAQNNGLMNQNFIMNGQNVILNNQTKQIITNPTNFQQNPIIQTGHQQTVVLNTLPNGIMIQQPQANFSSVEGHHQVVNQIVNADGTTSYIQQTQQQRQIVISPDSKRRPKKRKSSNGSITPGSLSPASSIQMSPTPIQQQQPHQQPGTMLQITPQYQQTHQGIQLSPGISGLTLIPNKANTIGQQQQIILQNGQTIISQPLNMIGQQLLLPAGLVMAPDATLVQIQNMAPCGSIITPQGMVIRAQSPQQKSFLSPNTGQQFIVNNNGQVSPMGQIYGTQLLTQTTQGPQFVQHQQNTTIIQQQPTHIINQTNLNITGPEDLNSLNGHTIGTQTAKTQNMGHSGSVSPPDTTTHSPNSPDRPPSEKSGGSNDSMNMAMVQCVSSSNEPDHGVSPGIDSTQSPSNSIEYYERGSITTYHHHHQQNIYKHSDAKIRRIHSQHGSHTVIKPDSHESPQTTIKTSPKQILPGNFSIGELVWGAVRGHPSWPGKIVPAPEGVTGGPVDCVWVRWFGGRPNAEMVSVHGLKSLSEGLEAHHKAQKDVRKSRKLNTQLERAIQEAMAELDRISAVDIKTKIIVNNNTSTINNNKPIVSNVTSAALTAIKIRPPNARGSKLVKIAPAPTNLPTTILVTGGTKTSPNNNNNNNNNNNTTSNNNNNNSS